MNGFFQIQCEFINFAVENLLLSEVGFKNIFNDYEIEFSLLNFQQLKNWDAFLVKYIGWKKKKKSWRTEISSIPVGIANDIDI